MYPKLKTTLYHGTISEIKRVDVSVGKDRKDFGKGFYMASTKSQAIGMMHKKNREAGRRKNSRNNEIFKERLYEIILDQALFQSLNIKVFEYADEEWLDFIIMCRKQNGVPHDYDLVVGATADDDTTLCLKYYEDGLYGPKESFQAKRTLLNNLEVENLGIQYYIGKQDIADSLIKEIREIDWR